MLEALRPAHDSIQDVIAVQEKMRDEICKEKIPLTVEEAHPEARLMVEPWLEGKLQPVLESTGSKTEQNALRDTLKKDLLAAFEENETLTESDVSKAFQEIFQEKTRQLVLDKQIRPDGRQPDQIRPIWCDTNLLPRAHGSGLFTRGETQVLSITTLGMPDDEQRLDTLGPNNTKRYLHHYNFPPYSTGETGRIGGTKRREIGHGALAERALLPVIPSEADFPYTLRVVSEAISSNGSTSMASVCGSTLSLMDAGVPIKKMVAGIAMGLITDSEASRFVVLSDIQGIEDALGDMDFKVAGTRDGITALQMDIKIKGINWAIFEQALAQAKAGRFHILGIMEETISQPRDDISQYAPRIITIQISPEKIGKVIGPGGKMIRALQEETNTRISIDDDGTIYIATSDGNGAAASACGRGTRSWKRARRPERRRP
jgi:polyribonucleotide nucleotidyltransferase